MDILSTYINFIRVGQDKRVRVGKKSKNDNRVDLFIWHLRLHVIRTPPFRVDCLKFSIKYLGSKDKLN